MLMIVMGLGMLVLANLGPILLVQWTLPAGSGTINAHTEASHLRYLLGSVTRTC